MKLITAKCPDCGAALNIPEGSTNVVCEYCGSNLIVTDVLGSGPIMQYCMSLAYAAVKDKNYNEAYEQFGAALQQGSTNYIAWFAKASCAALMNRGKSIPFEEMIMLFENAFKYAPADKIVFLKQKAAGELIDGVRKSIPLIEMEKELRYITNETVSGMKPDRYKDFVTKLSNEFLSALGKASEYDPSNNEVTSLITKVKTAANFKPMPGINQQIHENFADYDSGRKKIYSEPQAPEHTPEQTPQQTPQQTQQETQQENTKSKSGCMGAITVVAFLGAVIAAVIKIMS